MRSQDAELDARGFALAIGRPFRTVARWLGAWHAMGVEGVRVVPSRGSAGVAYRVSPDLPERWARCELPAPQGVLREAA